MPELGRTAGGENLDSPGSPAALERAESAVDLGGGTVAVEEVPDVAAAHGAGGDQGGVDLLGQGVGGGGVEDHGDRARRVVPQGRGGGEVLDVDAGGAVDEAVDESEAQNMGFGTSEQTAGDAGLRFGQGEVDVGPGPPGGGAERYGASAPGCLEVRAEATRQAGRRGRVGASALRVAAGPAGRR